MSVVAGSPADVIASDMRALPEELRKALRPKLRTIAQRIADEARGKASWSSRIPGTIRVRTSFSANREGVFILAGGKNAPHARLYDLGQRSADSFRHPVYGHRDRWVTQATRPFFFVAAANHEDSTTDAVRTALDDASRAIGFGG